MLNNEETVRNDDGFRVREANKPDNKEDKKSRRIPLKKYTSGGRKSALIALCDLIFIIMIIAISIVKKGNAGIYVGVMMLATLIISAVGFIVGINSFKEENRFLRFSYLGTIINAAIWIGILLLYLIYV